MKRLYLFVLFAFLGWAIAFGQTTLTFEEFELPADTFIDPIGIQGGLEANGIFLPSLSLPSDYGTFWTNGWTVSTKMDSLTSGFLNQYSAKPGSGAGEGQSYGVAFLNARIRLTEGRFRPLGMRVTNSTFAYNAMRDGSPPFSRKFGGESGDDPDFFKIVIRKYLADSLYSDSIEYFLADFRFENNDQDYIVGTWDSIDLSPIGLCDSLFITIDGSDKGDFGLNTPTYFCMDNLVVEEVISSVPRLNPEPLNLYPNPAADFLSIEIAGAGNLSLWNLAGQLIRERSIFPGKTELSLEGLDPGWYLLRWTDGQTVRAGKFMLR